MPDEILHVAHVVIERESAGLGGHHARIGPVGDVDLVVVQQFAHGLAQQRRVVPGQRCYHQHGGLRLHPGERGQVIGETLESQQPAKRLVDGHLLLHRHIVVVHAHAVDVELGLLVGLGYVSFLR